MTEHPRPNDYWPRLIYTAVFKALNIEGKLPEFIPQREVKWKDVLLLFLATFGAVSVVLIMAIVVRYVLFPAAKALSGFVISIWTPENSLRIGVVGVAFIFVIGLALYEFKRRAQWVYGLLEVAVSFASGFYTFQNLVNKTPNALGIIIPIATVIYFTQRGLTNLFDGFRALPDEKQKRIKDFVIEIIRSQIV